MKLVTSIRFETRMRITITNVFLDTSLKKKRIERVLMVAKAPGVKPVIAINIFSPK